VLHKAASRPAHAFALIEAECREEIIMLLHPKHASRSNPTIAVARKRVTGIG
jgi:hypothetical protein